MIPFEPVPSYRIMEGLKMILSQSWIISGDSSNIVISYKGDADLGIDNKLPFLYYKSPQSFPDFSYIIIMRIVPRYAKSDLTGIQEARDKAYEHMTKGKKLGAKELHEISLEAAEMYPLPEYYSEENSIFINRTDKGSLTVKKNMNLKEEINRIFGYLDKVFKRHKVSERQS